jgi:hypothetical protein
MTKMTLTRLLSEIKTTEEQINKFPIIAGVGSKKTNRVDSEYMTVAAFEAESQSRYDRWFALQSKLIALKAARNKANTTTMVTVRGETMSMDTAVAKKALLPIQQAALTQLKNQIAIADRLVQKAETDVQTAVEKSTNTAAATGGSSNQLVVSTEQIEVFKAMYDASLGKTLVIGSNIKAALANLEAYIAEFTAEIDYVLSEANAITTVEVE